jgi:hypothetical protein
VHEAFQPKNDPKWLYFSQVWNQVVEQLRGADLLSDAEKRNMVFVHLDEDPVRQLNPP